MTKAMFDWVPDMHLLTPNPLQSKPGQAKIWRKSRKFDMKMSKIICWNCALFPFASQEAPSHVPQGSATNHNPEAANEGKVRQRSGQWPHNHYQT